MLLVTSKEGQLANRLLLCSSFLGNAIENKYPVFHFYFSDYFSFFSESFKMHRRINPIIFVNNKFLRSGIIYLVRVLQKFKFNNRGIFREIVYYESINSNKNFDLGSVSFVSLVKSKIVFIRGWFFADFKNVSKHQDIIRSVFTPNKIFVDRINDVVSESRQIFDVLVGVHIRRGDYKQFNEGIWYYDNLVYVEKMKCILKMPEFVKRKVCFIICSNDFVDPADFKELSVIIGSRHFIEDIYLLARTDFIIGPPSTFSMWASFYGSVPLCHIEKKEKKIVFEDFKIHGEQNETIVA